MAKLPGKKLLPKKKKKPIITGKLKELLSGVKGLDHLTTEEKLELLKKQKDK